ncbi:MAG TPA: hypothetical protein VGA22_11000 [Gemmatimonadales bacterium]|jgi:hypothetical protein
MSRARMKYTDRFGYDWVVRIERSTSAAKRVTFTCGKCQLVVTGEVVGDRALTTMELKDLFCEAERVFEAENEVWYVGYRQRSGAGGRVQGGLYTRFRSEDDEVRYAREMLLFRQMAEGDLLEHLAVARQGV